MDIKEIYFTRRFHCPDCDSLCLIIDNEIMSCPVCDVSLYGKIKTFTEEETSLMNLKFNKSSCTESINKKTI